jgi:hypothetical protein
MAPVAALMARPVAEENVPPLVPVTVGVTAVAVLQNELLAPKLKVAEVAGAMVTVEVADAAEQPPEAAMLLVTV